MNASEDRHQEDLRKRIHAFLSGAGVEVAAAGLMLFPVPSRPECRILIAPDGLHEVIESIAGELRLEPVPAHRGVWLHTP
jgi:hypothetical protein